MPWVPSLFQFCQNTALDLENLGFGPFGPPQQQQKVVDVTKWPLRFDRAFDARLHGRRDLIGLLRNLGSHGLYTPLIRGVRAGQEGTRSARIACATRVPGSVQESSAL